MTVLGAAIAAGLAVNVWSDETQLPKPSALTRKSPKISSDGMHT